MEHGSELHRELERLQKENFNLKLRIHSLEHELSPDRAAAGGAAFAAEIAAEIERRDQLLMKAKLSIQSLSAENDTLAGRFEAVETMLSQTEAQLFACRQRLATLEQDHAHQLRKADAAEDGYRAAMRSVDDLHLRLKQQAFIVRQLQLRAPGAGAGPGPGLGAGVARDRSMMPAASLSASAVSALSAGGDSLLDASAGARDEDVDVMLQWRRFLASLDARHAEELAEVRRELAAQADSAGWSGRGEAEVLRQEAAAARELVQTLRAQGDALQHQCQELRADAAARAEAAAGAAAGAAAAAQELEAVRAQNRLLHEDLGRVLAEHAQLRTQLPAAEGAVQTLTAALQTARDECARHAAALDEARALAALLPAREATIASQKGRIDALEADALAQSRDLAASAERARGAEQRAAELSGARDELHQAVGKAEHNLGAMKATIAELQAARTVLEDEAARHRAAAADARDALHRAELALAAEKARAAELETRLAGAESARDARASEALELGADVASYRAAVQDLEQKRDALRQQLDACRGDAEYLAAEKRSADTAAEDLRAAVRRQEAEHTALVAEKNAKIAELHQKADESARGLRAVYQALGGLAVGGAGGAGDTQPLAQPLQSPDDAVRLVQQTADRLRARGGEARDLADAGAALQRRLDAATRELDRLRGQAEHAGQEVDARDRRVRECLAELDFKAKELANLRAEGDATERNLKEALDQRQKLKGYVAEYKDKLARNEARMAATQERLRAAEALVADRVKEIEQGLQRQVRVFLGAMADHVRRGVSADITLSEIKRFEVMFLPIDDLSAAPVASSNIAPAPASVSASALVPAAALQPQLQLQRSGAGGADDRHSLGRGEGRFPPSGTSGRHTDTLDERHAHGRSPSNSRSLSRGSHRSEK